MMRQHSGKVFAELVAHDLRTDFSKNLTNLKTTISRAFLQTCGIRLEMCKDASPVLRNPKQFNFANVVPSKECCMKALEAHGQMITMKNHATALTSN